MTSRPNILWICTDQQRHDTLGCYGNPHVASPVLDRLAAGGTLFAQAFTQSPLCTPSRASFLTGRYPSTTRCRRNGQDMPEDALLVTKLLADAGYRCGLAGKLHLRACHPAVCPGEEPRLDDGYTEFHWSHHSCPGMRPANQYGAWLAAQGETYATEAHPDCEYARFGMPEHLHQTTWCAERAIDFIQARAADDAPWLFSLNCFDPHSAFDPPRERFERYLAELDAVPLPAYVDGELDDKPRYQQVDHHGVHGGEGRLGHHQIDERGHRLIRAAYWAMCDTIDAQVGRILDALEASGQRQDTIVVFHSDHGEMLGDHGIYLKGPYCYDALLHVPLIVSWPGRVRAQHAEALVELVDLAATLLEAAGLPVHPGMQGRSLWPLLTGAAPADHHRDEVYAEFANAMYTHDGAWLHMVRDRTHKLVVDHPSGRGELYDLVVDPGEHRNRWDDPAYADDKARLLLRLCARMADSVDPLPPRRADW